MTTLHQVETATLWVSYIHTRMVYYNPSLC